MANRSDTLDPQVQTIADLKRLGSARLPQMFREFVNEGAMDMVTQNDNEAAFDRYKLRSRVLVNVSNIDTSTSIFGTPVSVPVGFAPSAMHKLAHPEGEVATSRAAAHYGVAMSASAYGTASLEEIAAQGKGNPYAFQFCLLKDRRRMRGMIRRAEASGYKALLVSVDVPLLGKRLNELRNEFSLPEGVGWPNLSENGEFGKGESPHDMKAHEFDATFDWDTMIPWLRSETKLPIWLKGITCGEDVLLAIRHGVDGIIVSNHGGRQLDGLPASLDLLRECVMVAEGRIPIAVDGGIRRGSDIFKALALGASYCFVGRIPIWGLAYNGQEGVELAIKILMQEFKITMGLAGCRSVKDITRAHVSYLNAEGILAKL